MKIKSFVAMSLVFPIVSSFALEFVKKSDESISDKPIINPIEAKIIEPMNVPIIYAIGDKPKPQAPEKEIQKPKPIDKTKYFVEKTELQNEEFKQEKIKLDDGKAFFETLNEKESKPIDIEK
jgi:hypothetical protein